MERQIARGVSEGNGHSKEEDILARAREHLERREFQQAVDAFEALSPENLPNLSRAAHELLGTAHILLENYDLAWRHLQLLAKGADDRALASKLLKADAGRRTNPSLNFPTNHPHVKEELLAAPISGEGSLPLPHPARPKSLKERLTQTLGNWAGEGVEKVLSTASPWVKHLIPSDEVWTSWYRRPAALGIIALAYVRQQLDLKNLTNVYPAGEKVGFQSHGLVAPLGATAFRTIDGSWNNLDNPKEGAAGVRFPRNVRREVTWPRQDRLLSPNPAELSQTFFARQAGGMKPVPFLNLLAAAWIQFNVHDWVSHRSGLEFGAFEVPLPEDHPARVRYHQTKMFVGRTEPDPTRSHGDADTPPTYINEVTSWWDASQIYGSDLKTAVRLRELSGGRLKLLADNRLPVGTGGYEDTGFNRNWWLGLALLHTLFVREHNAICEMLQRANPDWDDDRLYHTARLINAAVIAKIHTVEWTPAILPNRVLQLAMNANWYGLLETNTHRRGARKVFRSVKIGSPEVGGIVGNGINKFGFPFGLSEEFTEVYRLHDLLPDELTIRRIHGRESERIPLVDVRLSGARTISDRVSMADLFFSFGNMHPGQLVLNNYPDTLRELSIPGNPVYDLAAVDILRARERGVPRYNEFRRQLGLQPIRRFEDLTDDPKVVADLKRLYENDLEAVDLLVGTRAESHRPTGYGFGETMFQLFILNASRRLQADRFYTDNYNEATYTAEGLAWIDATDLKAVLLRHYPELAETGLANVKNAFEPWDTGEQDPSRHPLNAFE